ncbi:hypothetical protein JAAARDRAFT_151420 [Jaapia argillacea MUCL 33604]|uniref:phosphoserine transaminase n=1 Tax=Jaapia argillacea MUCL 33604 TaxID=933084 RepID=A0A067Q188_9AGAM|nr:hypothetical protein JAAARDRAFT_151420 [Jaapia argillacea MUCL 33604]
MASQRVMNFGAGPSALPTAVLEKATEGLFNFAGTGIGIAEISHRSTQFRAYIAKVADSIRTELQVPSTHQILFMQGGGTGQFATVVLNMLARHRLLYPDLPEEERTLDYCVTGQWSKKAMEEAQRLGGAKVNVAVNGKEHSADGKSFDSIPPHDTFKFSANPALIYYCENETVDGVQYSHESDSPASFPFHLLKQDTLLPLVADYSSSFMSRPINRIADHAIVFAGAQKNLGPAGLTVVIVRQDCIVDVDAAAKLGAMPVPIIMAYKTICEFDSLYNTPSVLAIYVAGLVLDRMKEKGGIKFYEAGNKRKSEKLYAALQEGVDKGVIKARVKEGSRSWMNITFDVLTEGGEARYLEGGIKRGMKGMDGHRSVGGIRVSLYNAITEEETDKLVEYIKEFVAAESAAK